MPWKMFLIEETEFCRLSLRRFAWRKDILGDTNTGFRTIEKPCPRAPDAIHDVSVVIDPQVRAGKERSDCVGEFAAHPAWPKQCPCGYVFEETDQWQVNYLRLYRGSPDGNLYELRESPPGATWHADWFPDEGPNGRWTGPDGKVWCVMLPGGWEWVIYSHSRSDGPDGKRVDGPKWNVQGTIPQITVTPSINCVGHYHGFVTGGVISDDCEGRTFPMWPATA
jgi:hypothetical protein